MQKHI